jgi:hypothetical protein
MRVETAARENVNDQANNFKVSADTPSSIQKLAMCRLRATPPQLPNPPCSREADEQEPQRFGQLFLVRMLSDALIADHRFHLTIFGIHTHVVVCYRPDRNRLDHP